MSKRKVYRPTVVAGEVSSDSELDYSDSENDSSYNTGKKIRFSSSSYHKKTGKNCKTSPKEDNEHTYSCIPIFNNVSVKDKNYGHSSESEYENRSSSRRISERSTSLESTKSGTDNFKRYQSKRKPKCFTKNAVMARQNRLKKKEYVESLEGDITCLRKSNDDLKSKLNEQQDEISTLKNQIHYLRSALMNNKEIGVLIRRVCGDKMDLKLTSSLLQVPPVSEPETNSSIADCYEDAGETGWPLINENETIDIENILKGSDELPAFDFADFGSVKPFGVCLHVANKQVSLEFCESCNRSAMQSV